MMWLDLERQVFGGTNQDIALRLVRETMVSLMYETQPQETEPERYYLDADLDELALLMHRADNELGESTQ